MSTEPEPDAEPAPEHALSLLGEGELRGPAPRAWRLFERAWPALTRRLTSFLRSLDVPERFREDCGQNALLRVWRARETYRGETAGALCAWLHRICERELQRLLEAEGRTPRSESAIFTPEGEARRTSLSAAVVAPGEGSAGLAERADALDALEECLSRLEAKERAAVELLYSADALTERQAAEVLGVSKSTVNVLRQRSLESLARCLRSKGVE